MFPTATVEKRGNQVHVTHGDDSGLMITFYFNKIHETHYVRINIPGDSRTEWDRPVQEQDKMRFQKTWEAYQSQQNQFGTQTMLKDWGAITEAQARHYNALNVHTVEHLAGMTDSLITAAGMGARELVRKAQGYLADLTSKRQLELSEVELRKRDAQIAIQGDQLTKLNEQVAQLLAAQAPKADTLHVPNKGGKT